MDGHTGQLRQTTGDYHDVRQDLQRRVASNLHELTPNDREIADYILDKFPQVAFETAQEIADRVGVSKAAVVRLATRLGYDGFTELKTVLRQHVNTQLQSPLQLLQAHEKSLRSGAASFVAQRTQRVIDNLAATTSALTPGRIERIARVLAKADRLVVSAERKSWGLAVYCAHLFGLLRAGIELWPGPAHPLPEAALDLTKKDALVILSFRRYSVEVLDLAVEGHKQGAWVLAITDNPLSPSVNAASEVVVCQSSDVSIVDSMIVPVFMIETLAAVMSQELGSSVQGRLRKGEALASKAGLYRSTRK